MTDLTITIPDEWWMRQNMRLHYQQRSTRTRQIREHTAWTATAALKAGALTPMTRVHICAWIAYPTARRIADVDGPAPTVKAAIDGLVDAGVIPDDDSEHVVAIEYRRDTGKAPKGTHTVRLTLTDQGVPF